MLMIENEYIYTEARISKSLVGNQWETDEAGNPIIIIEASNENLDFEGEKVLRSALLNSKEYFLQNGVISYDHKHLPSADNFNWDPEWNAEKYVIGKPLEAWEGKSDNGEKVVLVKAVLSRSNAIAKEIIGKLKDGLATVKASVGGRKVKKAIRMDTSTYKETPTIVGVNWDEVALTYKPVNQTLGATTLCPKEFVKSLTAGSSADPGSMGSGGNTLQMQGTEKKTVMALMEKIRKKEITKSCDAITHLVKSGCSEKNAQKILKVIIDKKYIGDVIMANENDVDAVVEESADELEKALADLGDGTLQKAKKDGSYVTKGGYDYMKKADGSYEKMDEDAPDYNGDEEEEEKEEKTKKSLETVEEYDATEDIEEMKKSIAVLREDNQDLKVMVKSLIDMVPLQNSLMKAIGGKVQEDNTMLKAISGTPQPRQTTNGKIVVDERFSKGMSEKLVSVTQESMIKSMNDAGLDGPTQANANYHFRKGGILAVAQKMPEVAEMLTKEK